MAFSRSLAFRILLTGNLIIFIHQTLYLTPILKTNSSESRINPNKTFPCNDYPPQKLFRQRGSYWVLYNYFKASKAFRCDESITYTTHADWTFLDNLIPLLKRWRGPISLAIYSPGLDYFSSFQRIQYLRECIDSNLVKDYVTFHIFFDSLHLPNLKVLSNPESLPVNCTSLEDSIKFGEGLETYKKRNMLLYPVNVARNIAREMATTHFVFPCDIELYPSHNLIPDFLDMIRLNETALRRSTPKVFVLAVFELDSNIQDLPKNKSELLLLFHNGSAIPFHKYVCAACHRIPMEKEWLHAPIKPGLKVFHISKRHKPHHQWEPFFIGTKTDPLFDERLSWEGRRDKMQQGYVMCVLDYEFHILDNAFLVHRPGIKRPGVKRPGKGKKSHNSNIWKQNIFIAKHILPELTDTYGKRTECHL